MNLQRHRSKIPINVLLRVQESSDVPEPAATPVPAGQLLQVLNSLLSALHWSAGQFSQPVDGFRACPAGHGSAKNKIVILMINRCSKLSSSF